MSTCLIIYILLPQFKMNIKVIVPRIAVFVFACQYSLSSVHFSCSVMSNSLWPHRLQHARPPCPLPTPGVYLDSCLLSRWCHPTIPSCYPLLLMPSVLSSIRVFSNESVCHIRWPKYWNFSFSISPSNEYSGQISLLRTLL